MIHQYFHENVIALQEEITKHPELMEILAKQTSEEPYIHVVEVATYCGVILDGDYVKNEIEDLCGVLVKKLQQKRCILILPGH
ncbi:MAG: hypothetical protein ACRDBG_00170 [Waterburya sp.]